METLMRWFFSSLEHVFGNAQMLLDFTECLGETHVGSNWLDFHL